MPLLMECLFQFEHMTIPIDDIPIADGVPLPPNGHLDHSLPTATKALSLLPIEGSQAPKLSPHDSRADP